ncbi:molybdenum cofactor guanylyltransferase [Puia dinghuensis]|uniref:MobA-like NTP transferase domain-containing protein n=1 Tax=Puia dinghuensis TaxID=1792502 RepID=A0A8J2U959_9BACT|nr:molybdenum cofactor guanylyltransferase [Puia dinghuensis]GGA87693.1 hypothetical protein GCM10011511_08580 [Puia dinghuensis]
MIPAGNLLGVVLSGGESRRMGRDKGLLNTDGKPWALSMGDKLAHHQLPVVYSINKGQLPAYSAILSADSLIVDMDESQGPLNGLLSVHRQFPRHDLLLVACDMQDLDERTIMGLIAAYRIEEADCYAYEVEGYLQPFCAIYTAMALARADATMRMDSLQAVLRSGNLRRLPGEPAAFRNYNSL